MEEENFPRGGVKQRKPPTQSEQEETPPDDADLFKDTSKGKGKKGRKDKNEEKVKKKHKIIGVVSGQTGQLLPEVLSNKQVYPGMLLLGCIKSIQNYYMTIALPNGLSGTVSLTNISHAYTESLQKFSQSQAEGDDVDEGSVSTLSEVFKVGMIVPCKLVDCSKTGSKTKMKLSIDPQDVNQGVEPSNIRNGMILYGSVISQEDHGYTVDIGVKNVQAFLKNKDAERYVQMHNDGYSLKIGQCVMCKIATKGDRLEMLAGENRVVSVSIDPKKIQNVEIADGTETTFTSFVAGMKVKAKVEKVSADGLRLSFMKYRGMIHKSHLPVGPKQYSTKDEVICTILYIHPLSKAIVLTLLPHLVNYSGVPTDQFEGVGIGDFMEEAVVTKVDNSRGVYLKLTGEITGLASLHNLSDNADLNITQQFKKGSIHRCRVLGFYPMENLVIVTMKQNILNQKYMSISDIQPGEAIDCTLKKFHDKGISVDLRSGISGFIPTMHLADVTLKHPEKKFKIGDKLKCRVLFTNKQKSNVTLTHKKSLVHGKYPIITDYSQLQTGQIIEGFISSVKDFGVHVRFFNDIQGFVPRPLLSTEPIQYPEKVFYRGQVVRCRVVNVIPQEAKLKITFVLEGKKEFGQKEADVPDDYEVGKCMKCRVIQKTETGIDVELLPSKKKGFLPKMHLSDSMEICDALWEAYKAGDIIEDAMYLNKTNVVLVTRKHCLISATQNDELITEFDKLQPGVMLAGSVKNLMSYGIFLEFPGGMFGLVPNQYATDKRVPDLKLLYSAGQSVVAKVAEVNKEKKRFLTSLRMIDCYHGSTETGIEMTLNFLQERDMVMKKLHKNKDVRGKLSQLRVGNIYKAKVKKVNDLGFVCDLGKGVNAIATKEDNEESDVAVGDELDCVLLYIDIKGKCGEISLCTKLVKDIKQRETSTNMEEAKVSQTVKSKVLLVKEDFVLVSLKGHAAGQLAYLPAKRHLNDVLERHQYGVGQVNHVVIKSVEDDFILASLKVHEDKEQEEEMVITLPRFHVHDLKLGDIKTAKIRKIFQDQIYVNIDGTHGRVHISEMLDTVQNGTRPMACIKVGDEVKVRVIGFRGHKSWRYLPISHPNLKRAMPECSMKPSILSLEKLPDDYECFKNKIKVGDKVVTIINSYSSHCLWTHVSPTVKGKVYILNITDKLEELQYPAQQYPQGKAYNATVTGVINDSLVELSFCAGKAAVRLNTVTKGLITCVKEDIGVVLQLPEGVRGSVELNDISDTYVNQPTSQYRVGQVVKCFVVDVDQKLRRSTVSLRDSRLKKTKCAITDPEIRQFSELTEGQVLRGFVVKCTNRGIHIRLGHCVCGYATYENICEGFVMENTESFFAIGNTVTVKVIKLHKDKKLIDLSMLEKDTGVPLDIPENLLKPKPKHAEPSNEQKRKRTSSTSSVESDHVKNKKKKRTVSDESENEKPCSETHDNDTTKSGKRKRKSSETVVDKTLKEGKKIKTVSEAAGDNTQTKKQKKKKRKSSESDVENKEPIATISKQTKQVKVLQQSTSSTDDSDSDSGIEVKVNTTTGDQAKEKSVLQLSEGFSWDADFRLPSTKQGHVSSDDSDDDEEKKPVKKSREELRRDKQEEEKRLYEYERKQLEGETQPETADDFDRLVLQSPDSSLVWLRYMAFHLETSEIDKARAIAERALKTISFREEQEKLNVWVAYLNLENMYGGMDSVNKVMARAVQMCDQISIYTQMINIYVKSNKTEEAEHLYNTLLKKHSTNKDVWVRFGQFYFQQERPHMARKLLQRALKSLDIKHHVEMIAKFAQMEFKIGEPERGKTMFDNVLSTYPKRTDLWSVYIDMVTKLQDHNSTRSLYNKVVSLKLSAKKMKFFFKKYLQFEEQHGSAAQIADVKKKALEYVESQGYVDE